MAQRGKQRRRTVDRTSIYRDADLLLTEVMRSVPNFPHHFQHTTGAELERTCTSTLRRLALVYISRDTEARIAALDGFEADLQVVATLLGKAAEFRWISLKRYAYFVELTAKINEQSSAWRNSLTRQPASDVSRPSEGAVPGT